jgi:chromosome segregation ATPase
MTIRFNQTSVHGALEALYDRQAEILTQLGALMTRGEDIRSDIEVLRAEQQETKEAALAAVARVRELVAALQAQVETLVAGQVTDAELAEIKAAAAAVKAEADAAQAELGEVAAPAPEPTPEP